MSNALVDFSGVLLLDKPAELTSNRALQRVRGIYGGVKAGHTGTLDPLATGLLPVCMGEMTKFSTWLLETDKTYLATVLLGRQTDTDDITGEVIQSHPVKTDIDEINSVLAKFIGEVEQVPPLYSALHHKGKRLYQLARQGQTPEIPARTVKILNVKLVSFDGERLVLEVRCGKGTYIRAMARDIGLILGCGGCIEQLRRTAVGELLIENAFSLERLQQWRDAEDIQAMRAAVNPVGQMLEHIPGVELERDEDACYLLQGRKINAPLDTPTGTVRLMHSGRMIGLGNVVKSATNQCIIAPQRMMSSVADLAVTQQQ